MGLARNLFDKKFGAGFLDGVPRAPGVYEMVDGVGTVIYVGKAKILRRRLQQYRNAKRRRRHEKMRRILAEAVAIRIRPCATEYEALVIENALIQSLRPKWNVAGAFWFLYPMIGLRREASGLGLCCTTSPERFPEFRFFGAYRSRFLARGGYYAMLALLRYVGHREPRGKVRAFFRDKYSQVAFFRQMDPRWELLIARFLQGESADFLEEAVLALLEKISARRRAAEVEENLAALKRFFRFEARVLRKAMVRAGIRTEAVSQAERDKVFLAARYGTPELSPSSSPS